MPAKASPRTGTRAISAFYVEFDNTLGPKVCAEFPEDEEGISLQTGDLFDSISDYLIPKIDCCGKLLTVTALGVTVIGHPSQLQGPQYARNNFFFNVGFLISDEMSPTVYEPLVSKLAYYLTSLEMESSFLSKDAKDAKVKVGKILEAVVQGLEEDGSVHLPVDDANQIHLNISTPLGEPAEVAAYQVPIQVRGFDISCLDEWDLTIQQVIPHIDGRSYIKQIAERANVHLPQALQAIKHLLYVGYIKLVDIFQYSNMYMVTPAIRELAENRDMQQECVQYVTIPGRTPPPITEIFKLYSQLRQGTRFGEFCGRNNTDSLGVDDCRLIAFGIVNKLLRRIHHYPAVIGSSEIGPSRSPLSKPQVAELLNYMQSGTHPYDEICCELGHNFSDVTTVVKETKNCVTIAKSMINKEL